MSVEKIDEVADLMVRVADRVDGTRRTITVRCGDSVTARHTHRLTDILRDVPPARRARIGLNFTGGRTDGLGAICSEGGSVLQSAAGSGTAGSLRLGTRRGYRVPLAMLDYFTRTWWESVSDPNFMLGGGQYEATQIAIDPSNTQRIVVAGRSGLWSSADGGSSWCPMVNGLMVAQARDIVRDPNVAGRFYTGSADFGFFYSTNSMADVVQQDVSATALNVTDIALYPDVAPSPSVVYVVNGNDGQTNWDVLTNPDPVTGSTWTSMNLVGQTAGKVPSGLAVRGVSASPVVVVGVQGSGIWRNTSALGWQLESFGATGAMQNPNAHASTAWLSGSGRPGSTSTTAIRGSGSPPITGTPGPRRR